MPTAKSAPVPIAKAPPAAHAGVMLAANHFFARYLTRLYAVFDGDLLLAIVLAEIGHHSVSAFLMQEGGITGVHNAVKDGRLNQDAYLPTNAFSIAQVTGIPRETVRRKIAKLVRRGWLTVADDGGLVVTSVPAEHFRQFNDETINEFIETGDVVFDMLDRRMPGEVTGTTKAIPKSKPQPR